MTMICPVPQCGGDMYETSPNMHVCTKCGSRLRQFSIDDRARSKLIAARARAGFSSVTEAAKAVGYHPVYLKALERGAYPLSRKAASRLASHYRCEAVDLLD